MHNRRTILKATAGLATVSIVGLSKVKAQSASERLNLGFIGVGKMGSGHLGKFLNNPDVEVVAVCDVVKERREHSYQIATKKYAERNKSGEFHGLRQFNDFRELLDMSGLDAVVIATPDHWHTIPCILAARAGKHVYCEKPLTHHIAEGKNLVEEVKKAKIVFQTGSQQRSEFGGYFRKAVETIWNGRIGKIQRIRIGVSGPAVACDLPSEPVPEGTDWNLWVGPAPFCGFNEILCPKGVHNHFPQWRAYREFGGGALADMGAHHFDIAQWAIKKDTSGPSQIIPPDHADSLSGLRFVYDNGIEMIHNVFEDDIKADCVFEGTEGMILVSRKGISSRPDSILEQPLEDNAERVIASSNHHGNWLEAIRTGKTTICTAEIGHRSASVCHLGNIGYRLRRKLQWDPVSETFLGDEEANQLLVREPRSF